MLAYFRFGGWMRTLLTVGIAVVLSGMSAYAADARRKMPVKAPPPAAAAPAPAFTWTGCYLGGHVGGGWGHKELSDFAGFELSNSAPLFDSSTTLSQPVSGLLYGG